MPLHHRAFLVTVVWTLVLLYLGSVVHATESSLACPDWPTCFGTMMPEMEGGVFWEHLHRLVAGGLLLMFGLASWLAFRWDQRPWVRRAAVGGMILLFVQAALGGITVIYQLPDAISTSHLSLAFIFLILATILTLATSRTGARQAIEERTRRILRFWGPVSAALVFGQSVIGALVRHTDAGMACPDLPLCIGQWIPPMSNQLVAIHFTHRLVGIVAAIVVIALALRLLRSGTTAPRVRRTAIAAAALVIAQITLGVLSVTSALAVIPVSLHTLGAALLLVTTVALSTWGFIQEDRSSDRLKVDLAQPAARV